MSPQINTIKHFEIMFLLINWLVKVMVHYSASLTVEL